MYKNANEILVQYLCTSVRKINYEMFYTLHWPQSCSELVHRPGVFCTSVTLSKITKIKKWQACHYNWSKLTKPLKAPNFDFKLFSGEFSIVVHHFV